MAVSPFIAFGLGVVLHWSVFRYGEWDLHTIKILSFALAMGLSIFYAVRMHIIAPTLPVQDPFHVAVMLSASTIAGLYTSLIIYRGFFHRLHRFPGPFAARFSNLYVTALSAKRLQLYNEIQQLHNHYGDIVRIGPSELSVNLPGALPAIHSAGTQCTKGPWYNILHPMVSLQMIRSPSEHMRRRKVWDRGFSAKALRDYEPRMKIYTHQLVNKIDERHGEVVNATKLFNFYSFDIMGDLAFGKSFGMLETNKEHYFMTELHTTMKLNGLFSHALWLYPLFKKTPILNNGYLKFQNWLKDTVDERRQNKPEVPDVFSWILQDHDGKDRLPTKQEEIDLIGDAYLIAVAGSDTTAATLTCLFFEITRNPSILKSLQREIDECFDQNRDANSKALGKLQYLDAVIQETLRLHPAVPSGLQRMTPREGLSIDGIFIPGDTIVQVPSHTTYRDPRYFARPDEFFPDRWTTEKHMVMNPVCFAPFSTGRSSCIGKQLGLIEVRAVVVDILKKYTPKFPKGFDADCFLNNKKDTFTLAISELQVIFEPRGV